MKHEMLSVQAPIRAILCRHEPLHMVKSASRPTLCVLSEAIEHSIRHIPRLVVEQWNDRFPITDVDVRLILNIRPKQADVLVLPGLCMFPVRVLVRYHEIPDLFDRMPLLDHVMHRCGKIPPVIRVWKIAFEISYVTLAVEIMIGLRYNISGLCKEPHVIGIHGHIYLVVPRIRCGSDIVHVHTYDW